MWPAAEILCEYLTQNQQLMLGKKVLEVGAGQGLVGMLSSLWSARTVITDYDDTTLESLRNNVDSNFSDTSTESEGDTASQKPAVSKLVWGNADSIQSLRLEHKIDEYDIIVGSDIM